MIVDTYKKRKEVSYKKKIGIYKNINKNKNKNWNRCSQKQKDKT